MAINTAYIKETYPDDLVLKQFAKEMDFWAPLLDQLHVIQLRGLTEDLSTGDQCNFGVRGWTINARVGDAITVDLELVVKRVLR